MSRDSTMHRRVRVRVLGEVLGVEGSLSLIHAIPEFGFGFRFVLKIVARGSLRMSFLFYFLFFVLFFVVVFVVFLFHMHTGGNYA